MTALLLVAALAAGCATGPTVTQTPSGSAQPGPTASASPSATAQPGASSTPQSSITAATARVTFDGRECGYTGPTVLPYPASLSIEFAPTDDAFAMGIVAIDPTATDADLTNPANPKPGEGTPWFVYLDTHLFRLASGTFDYRAVPNGDNPMAELGPDGKPYQKFQVFCMAEMPGAPVGDYTIIHLVALGQ